MLTLATYWERWNFKKGQDIFVTDFLIDNDMSDAISQTLTQAPAEEAFLSSSCVTFWPFRL